MLNPHDPRRKATDFGRKLHRDEIEEARQEACVWVATLTGLGGIVAFFVGFALDEPKATGFCVLFGFAMLLVCLTALVEAYAGDPDELV